MNETCRQNQNQNRNILLCLTETRNYFVVF